MSKGKINRKKYVAIPKQSVKVFGMQLDDDFNQNQVRKQLSKLK